MEINVEIYDIDIPNVKVDEFFLKTNPFRIGDKIKIEISNYFNRHYCKKGEAEKGLRVLLLVVEDLEYAHDFHDVFLKAIVKVKKIKEIAKRINKKQIRRS